MRTSKPFRLCSRAPTTSMWSVNGLGGADGMRNWEGWPRPRLAEGAALSADAPRPGHGARWTGQHQRETRLAPLRGGDAAAVVVVPHLLLVADLRTGADDGPADAGAAPD